MHYTYIIKSLKDLKLYVGSTNNVRKRLEEHNAGKNESTKRRSPFELVYYEALPTLEETIGREKFYKTGRGREVIKKILFKTLAK